MMSGSSPSAIPPSFLRPWKDSLASHGDEQRGDFPNYHVRDADCLLTSASPRSIRAGSGLSIFTDALLPAISTARSEIILVTCFWAESPTLSALKRTLEALAEQRRIARSYRDVPRASEDVGDESDPSPLLRIRICFSSRSLFQKLFHTPSRRGYTYPARAWPSLGLPSERILKEAGIELTVKSLFFLPFSVTHPKFLIIDRTRAFMPSCNVSWETWFETCVEFEGPAVYSLLEFYNHVWEYGSEPAALDDIKRPLSPFTLAAGGRVNGEQLQLPKAPSSLQFRGNPSRSLFPLSAPDDPLNAAVLTLIENARSQIEITTPNLTCAAVISHLLSALSRGVQVTIRTSKNMMLIEQLVTAGTTTSLSLRSFVKQYQRLVDAHAAASDTEGRDLETGVNQLPRPGALRIFYYKPDAGAISALDENEPVVSHIKLVRVDNEFVVLGSGNMDRASWYTSQELGILFYAPHMDTEVWDTPFSTRLEPMFPAA
ncbi:unnamed protein product [Parascedosporium putredinis]|uniref:PLD phosphodiesterase domain-containing protein n=1 Tax=Parascedosporium putredinis TaxID=1442378 RepID=A0A9P1M921_9PEZI|nr:unnamed protein product [Parascedosporium putredinis]CAI7991185.1 unnamed protein product [Parascedosporium putredinis]